MKAKLPKIAVQFMKNSFQQHWFQAQTHQAVSDNGKSLVNYLQLYALYSLLFNFLFLIQQTTQLS